MNRAKKVLERLSAPIVFTFLLLFPLGQLLRIELNLAGKNIPIIAIDLVAAISLLYFPFIKKPKITKYFYAFFATCVFSLIFSLNYFNFERVIVGSLYFVRVIIYFSMFVLTWNVTKQNELFKESVTKLLIIVFLFVALFGWLQYFYFFDLRFLKYAGWDDHLGRLVGTYLDPGFTGFILISAFFFSFLSYLHKKSKIQLGLSLLYLSTLLLTYSRASYLALLVGLLFILAIKRKIKLIILFLCIFLAFIPFLPRGKGEGVRLERLSSVIARVGNYENTIGIIKKYPLLGVGYNNICWVKESIYSDTITSHSCFGSDSSLFLIIATTGFVGLILFLNLLKNIYLKASRSFYGDMTKVFIITILVHSIFSNSMFYPWIMGLGAIYMGLSFME